MKFGIAFAGAVAGFLLGAAAMVWLRWPGVWLSIQSAVCK